MIMHYCIIIVLQKNIVLPKTGNSKKLAGLHEDLINYPDFWRKSPAP
jgi:hypothetical protein